MNFSFNSSTAPAGNAFGAPSTSGFGQSAAGGSNLFGNTAVQKPAGNLFGGASVPAAGGFGSASTTQPASTGGFFGAPASGGLFGSTQPAPSAGSAAAAGGMFGGGANTNASTGGLFGGAGKTTTTTGGLFGGGSASTSNTSSLFGGGSASTSNTGGLLGGGSANTTNTSGFLGGFSGAGSGGSTLFSGMNSQQQQQTMQVATQPKLDPKAAFSTLPPEVGEALKSIELKIHAMSRVLDTITQDLKEQAQSTKILHAKREKVKQKVAALSHEVRMDREIITTVQEQKAKDLAIASQCERENTNDRYQPNRGGSFDQYLLEVMQTAISRMSEYKTYIDDLERDMESVKSQRRFSPDVLQTIMRNQHDAYLALSSKVSTLHLVVEGIREDWSEYVLRHELSNDPVAERQRAKVGEKMKISERERQPIVHQGPTSSFDITMLATCGTKTPGVVGAPGANNISATTTTSSLFGGAKPAPAIWPTPAPASSALTGFGPVPSATPLRSTPGGGLFGSSTAAPATNTGLGGFGTGAASSKPAMQPFSLNTAAAPATTGVSGFSFGSATVPSNSNGKREGNQGGNPQGTKR
eukprot:CFRG5534T1